jgi:hypothetical protein
MAENIFANVRAGWKRQLPSGSTHYLRKVYTVVNGCYVSTMAEDKNSPSKRFEMVAPPEWIERVDNWRRSQVEIPSRAEAIRRLVDEALRKIGAT